MNKKKMFYLSILITIWILVSPVQVVANDYSFYTNSVLEKTVSWEEAVFYIDNKIKRFEERVVAIGSLINYHNKDIVPYLKKYAKDPNDHIRVAAFWPLYSYQEQKLALTLLSQELEKNNLAVAKIFYLPNQCGTKYKLRLSKKDFNLYTIIEQAAKNEKIDPWIRVHAAIHLTKIHKRRLAGEIAKSILKKIPPDPQEGNYNDWSELEQRSWHLRKRAKWCIELAKWW